MDEMIERNKFFLEKVLIKWFKDLLGALSWSKYQKVYHRDIKPANTLIFGVDRNDLIKLILKLADFGCGNMYDADWTKKSAKTIVGTTNYMSPEMYKKYSE